MTRIARGFLALLFALLAAAPAAFAQAQRTYSQAELDQMLAPIALYPDALLSQILMAATYPAELSEAARWSRTNPGLQGDDAVRAVAYEDWDPSVMSLVAFPQILARLDENPGWTGSLGDAFLMQEPNVMDTVQQLRSRAQAAGNLQSSDQMHVRQQDRTIVVQPASPQYVYVPYYDPLVVYGPWWWSAYRPVVWAPWPGYARPYRPGASAGFWWGTPVGVSHNFFFGNFDWRQRHVRAVHPSAFYYRQALAANRTVVITPQRWRHEPQRRAPFAQPRAVQAPPVQVQSAARVHAQSAAPVHAQPAARVQALPATTVRAQPIAHPRSERREERPAERAKAPVAVPPQIRMPAAAAPQQPRAAQQEHRERRQEPRNERGPRGRERS